MYDEKQLIIELRNGSHEAFRQLFDSYKRRVYGFLYNMLHVHEEVEELSQNVFIKIWESRENMDHGLSLSSYVFKIAKNSALNALRQKAYQVLLEKQLTEKRESSEDGEELLAARNLEQYINNLILQIPERRREIFLLRHRKKMSYKEIAEQLHISENTVDTQIRHALNFLREQLGKELTMIILSLLLLQ